MLVERLVECDGICWTRGLVNACKDLGLENCRKQGNKNCETNADDCSIISRAILNISAIGNKDFAYSRSRSQKYSPIVVSVA